MAIHSRILLFVFLVMISFASYGEADQTDELVLNSNLINPSLDTTPTPVEERAEKENIIPPNYFAITFYKPNYVLPFYYTASPYNKIYLNSTPLHERIKKTEIKYQISLKVPIWKNIFGRASTLHFAYTQLSYWQAYNHTAFFRETDYEPEIFLANEINWRIIKDWSFNFFNVGLVHESNGYGNDLERTWNRIYLEAISSSDQWMFSIKPWFVFHDEGYNRFNPNMANYLGYGELTIAYKYGRQVFSVQAHGLFEQGGRVATVLASWSFPITSYLNGYIQVFSGYGQSLIEYNHRTNSIGVGIALSNWI